MGRSVSKRLVRRAGFLALNGTPVRSKCFPIRKLRVTKRRAERRLKDWMEALEVSLHFHLTTAWCVGKLEPPRVLTVPPEVVSAALGWGHVSGQYESDFGLFDLRGDDGDGACYIRIGELYWPFCQIDRGAWAAAIDVALSPK